MEQELPLRDIHLPAAVGWWPLAPGWWLLLAGLVALAGFSAWLWWFLSRQTVKKLALRELESIRTGDASAVDKVRQINILLRRVALSLHPREDVAGLVGAEWLAFLDRIVQKKTAAKGRAGTVAASGESAGDQSDAAVAGENAAGGEGFSGRAGKILLDAPYRQEVGDDLEDLYALCRSWISRLPRRVA